MQKLSKNGVAVILFLVSILGWVTGTDIAVNIDTAGEVIVALGTIASFGLMILNQVSRRDVEKFIFKK